MTLFRRPNVRMRNRRAGKVAPINTQARTLRDTKLDKWLQRLSHFSQFGLFLFTIGTIYFTVLPLYQKALLDEAIARKEIELKQATILLEKAYKRVRANAVQDFVNFSGPPCAGLLIKIQEPTLEKRQIERAMSNTALGIDVFSCLQDGLRKVMPRSELHTEDRAAFEQHVLALAGELKTAQTLAISQYTNVPAIAEKIPEKLPVPTAGAYERQLAEVLGKYLPPETLEQKKKRELRRAISHEQDRIVTAYRDEVMKRIIELRKFNWNEPAKK